MSLDRILLKGFKSIADCDVEMKPLNVLIGANGAGKSNFIGFFKLLREIFEENLQRYVSKSGGPDALLHFGRKNTSCLEAEVYFGQSGYKFALEPTDDNRMMFSKETLSRDFDTPTDNTPLKINITRTETTYSIQPITNKGNFETLAEKQKGTLLYNIVEEISRLQIYHFHDTGETSPMKRIGAINDNLHLKKDGANLAAYLYFLQQSHPINYEHIQDTVRLVAPFFSKFLLRQQANNPEMIELEWFEEDSDTPFKAHHLSDGSLRFIALATLLLQPEEKRPQTVIIDEPELGLHPYAIKVLAALLQSVSKEGTQVIISTQSVELLSEFSPEDVIVVNREGKRSVLKRLENDAHMQDWLEDYTLGELWKTNIIGGRPA